VINAAAEFGRARGADSIVSVGGGSVIDTGKGVAILLREGGSLLDYQGFQLLTREQTPHVSIPTTAGTGSEVTCYAVVKDHENKRKLIFGDHHIIPNVAILDPALTVDLPPLLTAATGLDAFSHGLEAITSAQREPLTDALGLHAIRLICEYLPAVMRNGNDIAARGQMMVAATLGGAAFSNAQVGLVHAIAHVVGARYGVHHGMANAIAMPHVMRFNNDTVADRYRMVAETMGADVRGMSDEAAGLRAAEVVRDFSRAVGLPGSFREVGVPESDLPACAEAALSDGAIVYNSKPVTDAGSVLELLRKAWAGA
jgi:alcohol dehydrogenase class IV